MNLKIKSSIDMKSGLMIYGANGFTAGLIIKEALKAGIKPVVAGRNSHAIQKTAAAFGLEFKIFDVDDRMLTDHLTGIQVLLNCAGPFKYTAYKLASACLEAGVHYLDITGEIEVFEALHGLDSLARNKKVMLMPGTGFDVVPTDCLSAFLKNKLPDANSLSLAFESVGGRPSSGTVNTAIENLFKGGMARRDGKLQPESFGEESRVIDLGLGPRKVFNLAWGDVSSAYYSTGIPNIRVYSVIPEKYISYASILKILSKVTGEKLIKSLVKRFAAKLPEGPTEEQRLKTRTYIWGKVKAANGTEKIAYIRCGDGYTFTAMASIKIAGKVLANNWTPGFATPSIAYGPDFLLEIEGVARFD